MGEECVHSFMQEESYNGGVAFPKSNNINFVYTCTIVIVTSYCCICMWISHKTLMIKCRQTTF